MRTFIWMVIILWAVSSLSRLFLLSYSEYPRTMKCKKSTDALAIIVNIGLSLWALSLLYL